MKAMIFAAGLGSRLKPITDTMPKALVPVCGKTLLQRVIEKLSSEGFHDIVINVHHFGEQIIDYLAANNNFGQQISISDERNNLLDTGGGIKKASHFFEGNEPFLIHNVDILSNVSLKQIYDYHIYNHADVTLLASWRETQRYLLFDEKERLHGWINIATGQVKSPYENFNADEFHKLAFSGIHVMSPSVFKQMVNYPDKFPIMDFYLNEAENLNIVAYPKNDLKLVDVGKLYALKDAEDFVKQFCAD